MLLPAHLVPPRGRGQKMAPTSGPASSAACAGLLPLLYADLWDPLCDTPGVYFVLCRKIYPNLRCSVKISISLSHLSPFIKLLMTVSSTLELFDLKNSQIWSLLKLLFLEANANSKVNIVSQLLSRLSIVVMLSNRCPNPLSR
jgi:hypothetical protein